MAAWEAQDGQRIGRDDTKHNLDDGQHCGNDYRVAQVGPERHAGGGIGVILSLPYRRQPVDRICINIALGLERGHEDPKERETNKEQYREDAQIAAYELGATGGGGFIRDHVKG